MHGYDCKKMNILTFLALNSLCT